MSLVKDDLFVTILCTFMFHVCCTVLLCYLNCSFVYYNVCCEFESNWNQPYIENNNNIDEKEMITVNLQHVSYA